jgi:hypothetical protein
MRGLKVGSVEAAVEFFPSMCYSAYGLTNAIWATLQNPLETTTNFCNACYDIGYFTANYFKNLDWDTLEDCSEELKQFYRKFDSLSDSEKGQKIGYFIGKYGVDIFAGSATIKGVSALRKLKDANRLANLEALANDEKRSIKMATTWGEIRYSNTGAHIVPALPE